MEAPPVGPVLDFTNVRERLIDPQRPVQRYQPKPVPIVSVDQCRIVGISLGAVHALRHRPALKVVNTRSNAARIPPRPGRLVERKKAPTKEAGAVGYKGITGPGE